MPVTYTNRKGKTYYLRASQTKTGKIRYNFVREAKGNLLEAIPGGYEIVESVNGVVSLSKIKAQPITDAELALVDRALTALPDTYRASRKGKQLVIHEPMGADWGGFARILSDRLGVSTLPDHIDKQMRERMENQRRYAPVMRFTLTDAERRHFQCERWRYSGRHEGWMLLHHFGPLDKLVAELVPTLGTDEFFELY